VGLLINGHWHDQWYDTEITGGEFKRNEAAFRNWITPDGSLGQRVPAGLPHKQGVITCLSPWPALGPIAP